MLPLVHWSPYIFAIQQLTTQRLLVEWSEHKSFSLLGYLLRVAAMSAPNGYLAQEVSMWSNASISVIAVDRREGLFKFQRMHAVKCKA